MGAHDGQHHAGQAAAGADVEQLDARAGPGGGQATLQRRHDRQTVEQVLHEHLPRIPDGSQVVRAVPALHLLDIAQQLLLLAGVGRQSQRIAGLGQPLRGAAGDIGNGAHAACLREP